MTFGRARDARHPAEEQILSGDLSGDDALSRLLSDAAAPAAPSEFIGMSQAVSWFVIQTPRRSRMPAFLSALIAAKTLAVTTAASAAVGGVALAAATGSLPAGAQDVAHDAFGAPAAKPAATAPAATPSPSLVGLCRAYESGVKDASGKALDNPAFTVLVTAAGGKDSVSTYCVTVLADAPGGRPSDAGKPTDRPTGKPTDAGKPADAGKPTDAGKPADAGKPTDAGKPADAGKPTDLQTGKPVTPGRP